MSFQILVFQRSLTVDSHVNLMNMILAMVLAVVYQPVKKIFDKFTDRVFYYGEYDADTFTREISKILTYTADLQLLTRRVGNYIATSLKAEKVAFCIPEKEYTVERVGDEYLLLRKMFTGLWITIIRIVVFRKLFWRVK